MPRLVTSRQRSVVLAAALLVCFVGLVFAAQVAHDDAHASDHSHCLACRLATSAVPALAVALAFSLTLRLFGWSESDELIAFESHRLEGHSPRGPPLS